ncbi:pentapeptide repeat-containing protein [Micromonospora rhizosphaerae]|uniref:pentapeptide repeat-containing protein n=1 Tax=Micromonospora rhizosphaerae TaxID=568872 RepID=UPI00159EFB82|nr:pentapeptide repeat-containing protein [Micromonospora rhizosphaerae]
MFVVGPWLFTRHPQRGLDPDQVLKARNDVRTTLVQALAGLAVAGGLVVTYCTFRQNQTEQDRTYALRQNEQVNELYTKAVEQLGHDEAPVRLGALYSLVHLAQANPEQRQTVVDVLCAYLRMPYTPPRAPKPVASKRDPTQELQVRLTAQRLLGDHLRRPRGVSGTDAQRLPPSPDETFRPGIHLDLTGAVLFQGLHLEHTSVTYALFAEAIFVDGVWMEGATFNEDAVFHGATFSHDCNFNGVTFNSGAIFTEASFHGDAWFRESTFTGRALFDQVTFEGDTSFASTTFAGVATFGDATFGGNSLFREGAFTGDGTFTGATFRGDAVFNDARFTGSVMFDEATFTGHASFNRVTFAGGAEFSRALFGSIANFDEVTCPASAFFVGAAFAYVAQFRNSTFAFAVFNGASFSGGAYFGKTSFVKLGSFGGVTFGRDAVFRETTFGYSFFDEARVLHLQNSAHLLWPEKWTVQPDADDLTRGTLVYQSSGNWEEDGLMSMPFDDEEIPPEVLLPIFRAQSKLQEEAGE